MSTTNTGTIVKARSLDDMTHAELSAEYTKLTGAREGLAASTMQLYRLYRDCLKRKDWDAAGGVHQAIEVLWEQADVYATVCTAVMERITPRHNARAGRVQRIAEEIAARRRARELTGAGA